ncbi:hypothetical protein SLS62_011062 [Diatrype stigma]|uniref:Uncharacterized protein n=1 Tax=Diatrype stigma TaxID=117547 RepID=A0AAN9YFB2_9PEZI
MAFFIGRPLPSWNIPLPPDFPQAPPPAPAPAPSPYSYPVPHPQAPPYGGYYQPPELITKLYHKLSVIDYDLRCPIDLVHLIVKAAMRDPVIAQDIDLLVARRAQEFRPAPQQQPQNVQQLPPNPGPSGPATSVPPNGAQYQAAALQVATGGTQTPAPRPTPAPAQRQAAAHPPAAAPPAARPTAPPRSEASSGRQHSDTPEMLVAGEPLHLIKDPLVIPTCPRPAKSATELQVPQTASGSAARTTGNHQGNAINLTNDEADPDSEPREKPADYSKLLEMTEKDLGWHGKYDNVSDQRQVSLGIQVAIKIEKLLERLRGYMETNKSFSNRVHILTVMREIIMAPLQTEGSRIGREVRNSAYQYDDNFVWAVEKLTDAQKQKLKTLDGGKWVEALRELMEQADAYCVFPKLREALVAIDPAAANSGEDQDGEDGDEDGDGDEDEDGNADEDEGEADDE